MILFGLVLLLVQTQSPNATAVQVGLIERLAQIDTDRLNGEPVRLAWSPDGTQLYVQTSRLDAGGTSAVQHYVVSTSDGRLTRTHGEPDWVAAYWSWKSTQAAPGAPTFRIVLDSERRMLRSTVVPRGADIAGMGSGSGSAGSGRILGGEPVAVGEAQNAAIHRMLLHGDVIGEWVNAPIVPGETFGWSPAALGLIAYANRAGTLVIADASGRRRAIDNTSKVSLPAWSEDGSRLAFLQKTGRKRYDLLLVSISR